MPTDGTPEHFEYVHMTGARFEGGVLPVDVADELTRYQRLLENVAKHLFLLKHPERRRVPAKSLGLVDFEVVVAGLHDGSCGVDLAVRKDDALVPLPDPDDSFEDARALIDEAFAELTKSGTLPAAFPSKLANDIGQMGTSLRSGEQFRWSKTRAANDKSRAILTRETTAGIRDKDLTLEPEEDLINAFVVGVCSDPQRFDYKVEATGKTIGGTYTKPEHFGLLKEVAGFAGRSPLVALSVMRDPKTDKIVDVLNVEKTLPLDWSGRLDELSELKDGWLDGAGHAITAAAVQTTESILFGLFEEGLPRPGIFPTVEGGLHLEWTDEEDTEILVSGGGNATLYSDDLEEEGFLAEPSLIVHQVTGVLR